MCTLQVAPILSDSDCFRTAAAQNSSRTARFHIMLTVMNIFRALPQYEAANLFSVGGRSK
jgi:hypothetical protein